MSDQPAMDVFALPLLGRMSEDLSDMLTTEVISNNKNVALSYFSDPTAVNTNTVRNLSYKLAGEGSAGVTQAQLRKILKQLDQMYNIPDAAQTGLPVPHTVKAYLVGDIINVTEGEKEKQAKVTVTFKLRKCSDNQLITGGTVTGISSADNLTSDEELTKLWDESGILIKLIAGVVSVIVVIVLFFAFIRMMTGAR